MEGSAVLSRSVAAGVRRGPVRAPFVQRYWAFLSYSHADASEAERLHRALERFRVPKALVGRRAERFLVPARLIPIFRDRSELAAADDLSEEIEQALECSRHLIVLCSPAAAKSRWVDEEIRTFKRLRPDGEVLAVIVAGEPWASRLADRAADECFPPAMREQFDEEGEPTGEAAEPIAVDLRPGGDGRARGLLKLVAGMLDLRLDELVRRDEVHRHRRMVGISAASIAGMLAATGLAVSSVQARDEARHQRREAEGLIGFMLGDLRDRLEPIGKLEALDVVGVRALEYYEEQDKRSLTDEGLAQRARALTMMGDIAQRRADLDGALRRYREAGATTLELLRRHPDDARRLYDHSQNLFYIGSIAWQRGRIAEAASAWREYKRMTERMIALAPANREYLMEGIYADHNLGVLLLQAHERYSEAGRLFAGTLPPLERLIALEPQNRDYQKQRLESLAYLADAQAGAGRLREAVRTRERMIGLAGRAMAAFPDDMEFRLKRLAGEPALARLHLTTGQAESASVHAHTGVKLAKQLLATDPANSQWSERAARAYFVAAEVQLSHDQLAAAAGSAQAGCGIVDRLIARDSTVVGWSETLRRQCLLARARLALAGGAPGDALTQADEAVANAEASRHNTLRGQADLARARLLAGDALQMLSRGQEAALAWQTALENWRAEAATSPDDLALRSLLLSRVGQTGEAQRIAARLGGLGYQHPLYAKFMQQGG
ncbi:toll/interleukin-1 receptor domain-containing protein [uncultured Sphingomonas sp.]|uniref:toll/interleukin-1 receptor domain-containing protein n=1 Tax=uncultured Sphingomonas sp. TaxID=158754 RepID=UPI0025F20560|nr:toll/interleukin-1 receptor domain-containing protein [uncultured Sphingomonas sp.]